MKERFEGTVICVMKQDRCDFTSAQRRADIYFIVGYAGKDGTQEKKKETWKRNKLQRQPEM